MMRISSIKNDVKFNISCLRFEDNEITFHRPKINKVVQRGKAGQIICTMDVLRFSGWMFSANVFIFKETMVTTTSMITFATIRKPRDSMR